MARLGSGHTPSRSKPEYWENCTVPWITLADVWQLRDGRTNVISETKEMVSPLGLANSAAVKHPAGTVILSRTASVGFSAIMGRDMATSQDFATWTCGSKLEPRYLLHALRGMAPDLKRVATGSTHKTIYMPDIEQLRVPLPPLEEQRRIAEFLDAETARIDKTRTTMRRLYVVLHERRDAQRSLILRGATRRGPRTMHPMLGDLPVSWRVVPLKRLVPRIGVGVVVDPSSYFAEEGVPFLRGSNITEAGISLTDVRFMSEADSRTLWRSRLNSGDVVVIRAGYPGRAAVIPDSLDGANCASLLVIKKGKHLLPKYLEAYFNSPLGTAYVNSVRYGAAQEQVNVSHVVDFMVPVPPLHEQEVIVRGLELSENRVQALKEKLSRQEVLLAERRQALITAAVTGQFDVSTASGRNVTEGVTA
ncbi:restriction endonuclease subunit S [Streptomyces sp. NPDC047980]|uniref:restriction endonuclease subunit S n=1 Tax=Streptomyces sp. NPDC047980 TaxID=3365494 RepID=UPI00371640FA